MFLIFIFKNPRESKKKESQIISVKLGREAIDKTNKTKKEVTRKLKKENKRII